MSDRTGTSSWQIRREAGEVTPHGTWIEISDDPERILADVLRFALEPPDVRVEDVLSLIEPEGDGYSSPGGDSIHPIETEDDIPAHYAALISARDLPRMELWVVSRYAPGSGYDETVVEGPALRVLVRRVAEALATLAPGSR